MVGDAEEARDLTQDTFLKVFRALPRFRPGHTRAWVYRIATNVCLDRLRRRRIVRWQPLDGITNWPDCVVVGDWGLAFRDATQRGTAAAPSGDDPAARALLAEQLEAVGAALEQLRPAYRRVLVLRGVCSLSYAEIGRALGKTPPAVRSLLFRARKELRWVWQHRLAGERECGDGGEGGLARLRQGAPSTPGPAQVARPIPSRVGHVRNTPAGLREAAR
jgi:RNA polymerase sigma-70 factor (ECF subfamily)